MKISKIPEELLYKSLTNKTQEFTIFPTEQCNFRCTYCYEDFSIGRMKKETVKSIKELFNKRVPELDNLYLSWFGGEPLVAKDIVLDICTHAFELASKHNVHYVSSMTTNGYNLTPKNFNALTDVGVLKYQISLDGPENIHNKTRLRADGKGTFNRIWENLLNIRDSKKPANIVLRLHLDLENVEHIEPLIEDVKKEFIHDKRFGVFFKTIEKLGGKNDEGLNIIPKKERSRILSSLEKKLYGKPKKQNDEPYICYASKPNSLIIRSDGQIGKCTVALNDPRNNIGRLDSNGNIEINHELLAPWLRGLSSLDISTLSCPLMNFPIKIAE